MLLRHNVSFFPGPRDCPSCGSDDVRRSRRDHWMDYVLILGLLRPFRCRSCWDRHYGLFFRKRMDAASSGPKILLENTK